MNMDDTQTMFRSALLILLLLAGCATQRLTPELSACLARMQGHAAGLLPAFTALGYRPAVHLRLDEDMVDGNGFRKQASTLGDSTPGGQVRLRPSRLCAGDALGRAVVAHEMAHVALQHRGVVGSGITFLWEKPPQQEVEADELAYAVLRRAGGDPRAAQLVRCWLDRCEETARSGRAPRRSWVAP